RELGKGAWSTAIPVDGGEHVVRATAPGRAPFTRTLVIGQESDARVVEIPPLGTAALVVATLPRPPATPEPAATPLPAPLLRGGLQPDLRHPRGNAASDLRGHG